MYTLYPYLHILADAMRYSAVTIAKMALIGAKKWPRAWRSPELKKTYEYVVVGGGGHGLATAYYLAKNYNAKNIAVLEKAWIGGGNTGRNTTIVRSNYLFPESAAIYDFALGLYEGLSQELNYNIMLSQRGMIILIHSRHELENAIRSVNAMHLNGIDADLLSPSEVRKLLPLLNRDPNARFPIYGGILQKRAGTARHDAVAWGYARAASKLGVDIIQECEVTDLRIRSGKITGLGTTRGDINCDRIGVAVAGHSTRLADMAGFRLPVRSLTLQAMVSEPLKPILHKVVLSPSTGVYVNQSDKGELVIGGGVDLYTSYSQRGNINTLQHVVAGLLEMFPAFSRVKLMRQWGGIVDVVPDSSPIIDQTPVDGLYINCGWGTGGFKAIPAGGWVLAHLLATGKHHKLSRPFGLDRFERQSLIDEAGAAGISH